MRLLIVARNASAAETIRRALRYAPTCRVLGWVTTRRSCAGPIGEARPDVVVIDGAGEPESILACTAEVRRIVPEAKIVLLADRLDADFLADGAAAGIDAAIAKSAAPASVGMLIREVAAGNVFNFAPPAPAHPSRSAGEPHASLTARELEILRHVAAGLSNGRIAGEVWVTEQTVKFHLSNVYRKLGLANRTEAAHYAYTHGLVDSQPARPGMYVAA
jgi:DNA-binding NarL/FixJ family response regulator